MANKDRYHGRIIEQDRSTTEMRLLRDVLLFDEDNSTGHDHSMATELPSITSDTETNQPLQNKMHHFISESIKVVAWKLQLSEKFIKNIAPPEILSSQPTDFMTAYINIVRFLDKAIETSGLKWQEKGILAQNIHNTLREIEHILCSSNPESKL